MSKHLHFRSEYCYDCENLTIGQKCHKCGMPLCSDCSRSFGGYCSICAEEKAEAEMFLAGLDGRIGSMDNDYRDILYQV